MTANSFHPAVQEWFDEEFESATPIQQDAWPAISQHRHTLIAAPTGSGKTLAAFLASINRLVTEGLDRDLENRTRILYVSPLKALSNDIQKNLQAPLEGIRNKLLENCLPDVNVRALVRTGDTPQSERERMRREPPQILVTTPESLYILLTSDSGRVMLSTVDTVIVDELHALAGNKRGAHLSLSLERLGALCEKPPVRIGLSATQKPIGEMARYLLGNTDEPCTIINSGHVRDRDLSIETTSSPLEAVMANEVWGEIYQSLCAQIEAHTTTLIFVNTRRLAERVSKALSETLGEDAVMAHHGSLSREHRLKAEQLLKNGQLKALVATASLELGIDIGDIDLVCQIGSPRSISALLQRVGRSGHGIGKLPKGRVYPLTRDDLIECLALLEAITEEALDTIRIPDAPLDVLAQQIVAEVANREWDEQALFALMCRARPYLDLAYETYSGILRMLADGFSLRRGRRNAYLHWDRVNHKLRARKGARLVALTNGGAIPDQFDYDVIMQPEGMFIGTLNEDFAFESLPGDIFQLGNTSYRMLKIEQGRVFVEDAHGQPPNIPFWIGEAPGRTAELSIAVSDLRTRLDTKLDAGIEQTTNWLMSRYGIPKAAAMQVSEYAAGAKATFGELPTQERIILERFFDETGDMHLVVHSPFGVRINRAWGLALRKRFCRKFNFELQAAALEDTIILSLGASHSFPLNDVINYLNSKTVRNVVTQALLTAPMFPTRWRWVANIALAIPRFRNGKRIPAPFQRNDSEDLIAQAFPDQIACQENIVGDREIPDHPLVKQTLADCLEELMDVTGLEDVLKKIETGAIQVICKDLSHPSPLAQEILNANPYAFLDDTPAEERRTLAVQQRRFLDPETAADLGRLSEAAIDRVKREAWPEVRTADELQDALHILGFITEQEGKRASTCLQDDDNEALHFDWTSLFETLCRDQRAVSITSPAGETLWVARERMHELMTVFNGEDFIPEIKPALKPLTPVTETGREDALRELVRGRLEGLGPVTEFALNRPLGLEPAAISTALLALEQEGFAMRGYYTRQQPPNINQGVNQDGNDVPIEWCERGLLARIHRYTLKQLRSEIEPVSPAHYMQFLFHWHSIDEPMEGQESVTEIMRSLEGYPVAANAWEKEILPLRIKGYASNMLDNLCASGRLTWMRAGGKPSRKDDKPASGTVSLTPIAILPRMYTGFWLNSPVNQKSVLSAAAQKVCDTLEQSGASFFVDLVHQTRLLATQCEQAIGELVANGLITSDSFAGLRALISPARKKSSHSRRRRPVHAPIEESGRWSLTPVATQTTGAEEPDRDTEKERLFYLAGVLLKRYGVVFRKLLERETGLPPWRELLYAFRMLEARGEIRGGRFVNQFSGEQFALPDAVGSLRKLRNHPPESRYLSISAADPLNLTGIMPGTERVPALPGNRILYRDGVPVATSVGGNIKFIADLDSMDEWEARNALLRQHRPSSFLDPSSTTPV